ncbi:MAG: YIP1 family protein [Bacillota bacterium]|nr:YIP1 family protein [Bacillota bacterium]
MENEIIEGKLSFGEKVKCFFINPTRYFKQYKEKPKFGLMFVIISIVTLICQIITYVISHDKYSQYVEGYYKSVGIQQSQMDLSIKIANASQLVGAILSPLGVLVPILLVALIFFLLNKAFKGKATYPQMVSVCAHAAIIQLFYIIFVTIHLLITKNVENPFDFKTLLSFSNIFSKYVNVFSIWKLVVTIFGVSAVSEIPKKKSVIIVVLVFLLGFVYTFGQASISKSTVKNQPSIQSSTTTTEK